MGLFILYSLKIFLKIDIIKNIKFIEIKKNKKD